MTTLPTPEENAQRALSILVKHFNMRPGDVLQQQNLRVLMTIYRMTSEEFAAGLKKADQMGWFELTDNKGVRLTEAGFAAA